MARHAVEYRPDITWNRGPAWRGICTYPEWDIPGTVITTIPTADRAKATVKVRIAIDQNDPRILPDMAARVSFYSEAPPLAIEQKTTHWGGVVVPAEAIVNRGNTHLVYLVHDSRVQQRAVQPGLKHDSDQIVISGLQPGSVVAVGDLSRLRDGVKVRIVK